MEHGAIGLGEVLERWRAGTAALVPGLEIFDAHTHVGLQDPDGFTQTFEQLVGTLTYSRARGCFVFPFQEPGGYPGPNDAVRTAALEFNAAAQAGGGAGAAGGPGVGGAGVPPLMVPFCRVDPWADAVSEAERSLDLGARGIKLHPRAERFELDHPVVRDLFALADERGVPVLVHSGRGIAAPGVHLVGLASEFPGARVILAHAGATDLSWLWRVAGDVPNLLFDSSWWMPADLLALFALIPPAQVLFASDAPYGQPLVSAVAQVRFALQAGLSADQIRIVFARQSLALADGSALHVAGPAVGERERAPHLLLDRVAELIQMSLILWIRGADGAEILMLARLACHVPDEHDDFPVFAAVVSLLDLHDALAAAEPSSPRARLAPLMLAGALARTPDVPLPVTDVPLPVT